MSDDVVEIKVLAAQYEENEGAISLAQEQARAMEGQITMLVKRREQLAQGLSETVGAGCQIRTIVVELEDGPKVVVVEFDKPIRIVEVE